MRSYPVTWRGEQVVEIYVGRSGLAWTLFGGPASDGVEHLSEEAAKQSVKATLLRAVERAKKEARRDR